MNAIVIQANKPGGELTIGTYRFPYNESKSRLPIPKSSLIISVTASDLGVFVNALVELDSPEEQTPAGAVGRVIERYRDGEAVTNDEHGRRFIGSVVVNNVQTSHWFEVLE